MIGNKYLQVLFNYPDEDTSLNQLLELLKYKDMGFIDSLKEPTDWTRDKKLMFDKPYYHSKRISDFEKFKLQYTNPSPFRARNVYFDLDGINRI